MAVLFFWGLGRAGPGGRRAREQLDVDGVGTGRSQRSRRRPIIPGSLPTSPPAAAAGTFTQRLPSAANQTIQMSSKHFAFLSILSI